MELIIIYIIITAALIVAILTAGKACYYCGDKLSKKPEYSLGHDSCMKCKVSNDKVVNSARHK